MDHNDKIGVKRVNVSTILSPIVGLIVQQVDSQYIA